MMMVVGVFSSTNKKMGWKCSHFFIIFFCLFSKLLKGFVFILKWRKNNRNSRYFEFLHNKPFYYNIVFFSQNYYDQLFLSLFYFQLKIINFKVTFVNNFFHRYRERPREIIATMIFYFFWFNTLYPVFHLRKYSWL
jgi:hypothetical protein